MKIRGAVAHLMSALVAVVVVSSRGEAESAKRLPWTGSPSEAMPAGRPATPEQIRTGADTLRFGFYTMIDGEAHAVPGETWTFDHGASDPLEGWTAEDLSSDPAAYFRVVTTATWDGHGNYVECPEINPSGTAWVGLFEDEAVAACWEGGLGYGNLWSQRFTSPLFPIPGGGDLTIRFQYFSNLEPEYDWVTVKLVFPDETEIVAGEPIGGIHGDPSSATWENAVITVPAAQLAGQTQCRLRFHFTSDISLSDEDWGYGTDYGPFAFARVSVRRDGPLLAEYFDQDLGLVPQCALDGTVAQGRLGWSTCLLDVNQDGYDDVIVGEPWYSNGQNQEGRVLCFHGGPDGISTTPSWSYESNVAGIGFGYSIAGGILDLGSPFPVLIVGARLGWSVACGGGGNFYFVAGAPSYSNGQANEGRLYGWHFLNMGNPPTWTRESDQANSMLGYSVVPLGDFDGDGGTDLAVSAATYTIDPAIYIYTARGTTFLELESAIEDPSFGVVISPIGRLDDDPTGDIAMTGSGAEVVRLIDLETSPVTTWSERWSVGVPGPNGTSMSLGADGRFAFYDLAPDLYTVTVTPPVNWSFQCGQATVSFTGTPVRNLQYGVLPIPNITDLAVALAGGQAKPGFETRYGVSCSNPGTVGAEAPVVLHLPPQVSFVSADHAGAYESSDHTVRWSAIYSPPQVTQVLSVIGTVSTGVDLGEELHSSVEYGPPSGDAHTADNAAACTQIVVGALDPNDKRVSPEGSVPVSQTLAYQVNFQNVGTAEATNIRIEDPLDDDLDLATVVFGASSHTPTSVYLDGQTAVWVFNNILLPDSTTNEPESHGFVTFQARPRASAPPGQEITNRPRIYFDYAAPLWTNAVTNTIYDPTGVGGPAPGGRAFALVSIGPVPARGPVQMRYAIPARGRLTARLYDAAGRQVRTLAVGACEPGALRLEWDRRNDAGRSVGAGIYFLRSRWEGGAAAADARIVLLE